MDGWLRRLRAVDGCLRCRRLAQGTVHRNGSGARCPSTQAHGVTRDGVQNDEAADDEVWANRLRWFRSAAIPSTLMMSVTTFISTDVASMPLLWVASLALYLLTFIIAFAQRQHHQAASLLEWLFAYAVVIIVSR